MPSKRSGRTGRSAATRSRASRAGSVCRRVRLSDPTRRCGLPEIHCRTSTDFPDPADATIIAWTDDAGGAWYSRECRMPRRVGTGNVEIFDDPEFGGTALFTHARAIEWLANARAQIGAGGLITVAAAAAFSVTSAPLWIATSIGAAMFFLADAISVPWTGYSRFLVYSLLAICGAVFATLHRRQLTRRSLMLICAAIVVLQLPAMFRVFALDFRPDHERNGVE